MAERAVVGTIAVYRKLLAARLRAQVSYRTSFVLDCVAQAVAQASDLVVILVLFAHTTSLGGFSVREVLLIYAFAGVSFGLADLAVGALDDLPRLLRTGAFDVLLLRPLGTLAQLATADVQLRRIGRVVTGLAVLGYVLATAAIPWTPWRVVLVAVTPLTGALVFGAIWVAACAVCFWLVDGREFANAFTYGGSALASYPITVFSATVRRLLAYLVPGAFVAYYPALGVLGRHDPLGAPTWLSWSAPLVAPLAAVTAGAVWRFAVRHYRGTGS